jgi:hypothetical protein
MFSFKPVADAEKTRKMQDVSTAAFNFAEIIMRNMPKGPERTHRLLDLQAQMIKINDAIRDAA